VLKFAYLKTATTTIQIKVQLTQGQIYCLLGGITQTTLGLHTYDSQVKILLTLSWNYVQPKINLILIFVGCLTVI
jgi:hypothetical protein